MEYQVYFTREAESDLNEIIMYISKKEGKQRALKIANGFNEIICSLKENPDRGNFPTLLEEIGIKDYREIHFKPWVVIYRVKGDSVYILIVADGRRNLSYLLERRLISPVL